MQSYLTQLNEFFSGELGRIMATCLVIAGAVALNRLYLRYIGSNHRKDGSEAGRHNAERARQRLVAIKNVIFFGALAAICTIWATKIAGVALSLAAFAGAMVLSAKELIMCATGYLFFNISRPYRVGDYIEVAGMSGRVIDVDLFATTVAETASTNQLTGKSLTFPNSLLLSQPVRNHSGTGEFVVSLLRLAVPYDVDRALCEAAALKAGTQVCEPWHQRADQHFRRIEESAFVDLPSSRVKVMWEAHDIKQHWLIIRFSTPLNNRVNAQQEIQRLFWAEMGEVLAKSKVPA